MTAKMPAWVADRLIQTGVMTEDRVTATAKPRRCRTCHAPILAGLDSIGRRTEVDRQPVSALGELQALMAGRPTFGIFYGQLDQRDAAEITYRPADIRPVYAAHQCHSPPLAAEMKFVDSILTMPTADQHPPF